MDAKEQRQFQRELRQKTGKRIVRLFVIMVILVFIFAWISKKPSLETDGRNTEKPVVIVTFDSSDLRTPLFHPISVDLKINGQDQAADVEGKKYKTKWISSGADSCSMISPVKKKLSLSGNEVITPRDSSLYPHHKDGLMVVVKCLNNYTESADTVFIFS